MAKAKKPVTINGIPFDALLDETRTYEADSPDYPIESGFTVNDTIILKPLTVSMTLFVTDTPVTWRSRGHGGKGWTDNIVQQLENLYFSKQLVTIVTSERTYKNMAIQGMSITRSADIGYARQIPISFKEIRVTQSRKTTIPASYGKSGDSGANAGTASTSTSNTPASSGGSPANSESKSSIAYSLAQAAGLI